MATAEPSFGKTEDEIGPVLATGQVVPYTFRLVNPFPEPLTDLSVQVMSSCCSSAAPLPPSVAAGASFEVPVQYKAGYGANRRGLGFLLDARRTGGEEIQVPLSVIVDTFASRELTPLGPESGERSADDSVTWRFRYLERREAGAVEPDTPQLRTTPGLSARFVGELRRSATPGALPEIEREVEVLADPSLQFGPHQGTLEILAGGTPWTHSLRWTVQAPIVARPASFVLPAGDVEPQDVEIISSEGPFRIVGFECPWPVTVEPSLPADPSEKHHLRLRLPADLVTGAIDLRLLTDHERQPTVTLTLVATGNPAEDSR